MARKTKGLSKTMRTVAKFGTTALLLGAVGFVGAIGVLTLVFAPNTEAFAPATSSDAAAWVQAVGSIAAILGALFVARRQENAARALAAEMESLRIRRHIAGMRTVVDRVLLNARIAYQSIEQQPDVVSFDMTWRSLTLPSCESALRAYAAIPIHELGSMSKLYAALDIESFARKLIYDVNSLTAAPQHRAIAYQAFRSAYLESYQTSLDELRARLDERWPTDYTAWAPYNGTAGI